MRRLKPRGVPKSFAQLKARTARHLLPQQTQFCRHTARLGKELCGAGQAECPSHSQRHQSFSPPPPAPPESGIPSALPTSKSDVNNVHRPLGYALTSLETDLEGLACTNTLTKIRGSTSAQLLCAHTQFVPSSRKRRPIDDEICHSRTLSVHPCPAQSSAFSTFNERARENST